tara:strand:+ start:643 stop:834 length:192 start_codon:yes stop_codon:yes gene_type:complete
MTAEEKRAQEKDIDTFAKELARERMDKIVKEKQNQAKAQTGLKEKLKKKEERMKNFSLFKGNP